MPRVLLKLRKGDRLKYLSHRDLVRAFELALRRAEIQVAFTSGFNPRPKMSFGSAVGVGITSDDERIVLELAIPYNLSDIFDRLNSKLPEGFELRSIEYLPDEEQSPVSCINASRFRMLLEGEGIEQAVGELIQSSEVRILRTREDSAKEMDIRPYILDVEVASAECNATEVFVSLRLGSGGGAGPHDFVQALLYRLPELKVKSIHRIEQYRI